MFRTSLTALSQTGRALLGLVAVSIPFKKGDSKDDAKRKRRQFLERAKARALAATRAGVKRFWGVEDAWEDAADKPQTYACPSTQMYMKSVQELFARQGKCLADTAMPAT